MSAAMQPGPLAGTTVADFMTRLVAFIIDGVIIGVANQVVGLILGGILIATLGGLVLVLQAVVIIGISAGYFIYFWTVRRQTPGMIVMKLLVVQDSTGAALTQPLAIRRWMFLGLPLALGTLLSAFFGFGYGLYAFYSLAILFTLAPLVGLIAIAWEIYLAYMTSQDPRRQGPHDKAVNSVVVSYGPSPLGGSR